MKKILSTLHRWLGFPLGMLFVVTFGTGCLTAVDELLARAEHALTKAGYLYRSTSIEEDARVLSIIIKEKEGIQRIILPSKDRPYYQVRGRANVGYCLSIKLIRQCTGKVITKAFSILYYNYIAIFC